MNIKNLIFIIGLFSLISCTVDNRKYYTDFPETIHLNSTVIELDTAIFRYPYRIRVDKDRALIMDLHNPDYYYHLFTYPDFSYLSSFGKRGNAPGEMLSAENIRITQNGVQVLDANKRELREYSFNLKKDSLLLSGRIVLNESLLRPLDFVSPNDSVYIIPDYSGESRMNIVDTNGQRLERFGTIATTNDNWEDSKPALAQAWRSFIDYNRKNKLLVAATQLGEIIEIYKDTTHILIEGPFGEPEYRISGGNAVPSGIMGFSDILVTDNYIYAVFHGRTFKELMQQKVHIDGGQYIYVFDFEGNPVRKYVLDSFVYGIYVDETSCIILATDVNKNQPILKFNMNIH